jgi:hypothetical protein
VLTALEKEVDTGLLAADLADVAVADTPRERLRKNRENDPTTEQRRHLRTEKE